MSIFRVNKTEDYTVMSNYHLRDTALSLKAKGLLSQMLSLPPDWDFTIAGLTAINIESESAIKSALKELKDSKYLIITKIMPDKTSSGRIEYIYDIYEQPFVKQEGEKQEVDFLPLEIQRQLNTDNKVQTKKRSSKFIKPTYKEVEEYCNKRNNNINPEAFIDYYERQGWLLANGRKMVDWKAAVRTWERNFFGAQGKKGKNGIVLDDRKTDELDAIL